MPPFTVKLSRKARAMLASLGEALIAAREAQGVRRVDLLDGGMTQPLSRRVEGDTVSVGLAAVVVYLERIDRLDALESMIDALTKPKSEK